MHFIVFFEVLTILMIELNAFIATSVYEYNSDCETYNENTFHYETYNDAVCTLQNLYVKPINEVFAKH